MRINPSTFSPGEALLWRHGVVEPEFIDLDGIAAAEGAEVRYRALDGCEARLVVFGDRGIISIKPDPKYPGRQRFSLAHELAHWQCDRAVGGALCAADDISPSNTEAKGRESAANNYASQLVLPDYLVAPRAEGLAFTLDAAQELARAFRSSLTAAVLKLLRHTARPAAVACHLADGRCWFRKSRSLPPDAYILGELHYDGPAIKLLYGDEGGRTRPHTEPATRWMSGPSTRGKDVCCQSLKLPDAVLTTLELLR
ncbi:ImmA/IrrE family metallo-endopeptidase [Dokdonella sp.]|uniref:ImmA/IrrE family metallo-endopeptidase n=1 Tax=Dokdonella sp. TaxID=2291710 RepID=UPI00378305D6